MQINSTTPAIVAVFLCVVATIPQAFAKELPPHIYTRFVGNCELSCHSFNDSEQRNQLCSCACEKLASNITLKELERFEAGNGAPVAQLLEAFEACYTATE